MNVWVEAARPRTLPAAVAPVLVGAGAARVWDTWRFAGALVVALSLQVAVNYANDYFDGVRGVDTADRVGPRRATASGLVQPGQMKVAIGGALAVAGLAGLGLTFAVGPELLLVGVASIAAALAYSGGPRPYASAGLGELFVFTFFGPVATIGTAYVLTEELLGRAVVASIPVGLVAAAILVVNNVRDISTDAAAGKRTLAVRLGPRRTRHLLAGLVAVACAVAVGLVATAGRDPSFVFAVLGCGAVLFVPVSNVYRAEGAGLVPALGSLALLHLVFSAQLAVALAR
ncbi:MAG TPA: 1,4-dihydroxy-2-naphthoate polyprenyltransferase [Actinomycetota bacterium]|nr:1,4-dihydroxy-2-naphthoate polyprenyltransferase [Actinomycetota bacterium]